MREIKFRGKRLDNGGWVYGGFAIRHRGAIPVILEADEDSITFRIVYRRTVGQFTGLLDKNGKEIYEGDIFRFDHPDSINEVSYSIGGGFAGFDFSPAFTDGDKLTNIEIIGNIHDNPELINL